MPGGSQGQTEVLSNKISLAPYLSTLPSAPSALGNSWWEGGEKPLASSPNRPKRKEWSSFHIRPVQRCIPTNQHFRVWVFIIEMSPLLKLTTGLTIFQLSWMNDMAWPRFSC